MTNERLSLAGPAGCRLMLELLPDFASRPGKAMLLLACIAAPLLRCPAAPDLSARTAQEITAEATRPQTPEAGRALPLAAHWCVTPFGGAGFSPEYELKLIREGHHVML